MIRTTLALALLLPLVVAGANAAEPDPGQNEARLAEVRERIEALQRDIDSKKSRQDALNRDVESAEKKISAAQAEINTLRRREQVQLARLRRAENALQDADHQLDGQRQALASQIRSAYVIGQNAGARLLLNLSDVQKLDRMVTYYDYLARARAQHMQGMLAQVEKLRALRDKADEETEALAELRAEQQQALNREQGLRAARASQLAQLQAKLGDEQEELSQLRETEREVNKLLLSIQKALREMPLERPPARPSDSSPEPEDANAFSNRPFPSQKGRLAWPLRGPVLASFGQPKAGGRLSWNGQWIGADAGAPVHAVSAGRVVYTGWMHRYGLIVILEHESGYFTLYGHNQSIAHAAGDMVRAGDVIAAAGNTGGHEQTGVYFEVRRGTQSLDPRGWLGH